MRDNEDDPLDALIDVTARGISAGPLPSSLRTTVRRRIEQTQARWAFPVWQVAGATAATALVVMTLLMVRSVPAPVEEAGPVQATREPVAATPRKAPPTIARAVPPDAAPARSRIGKAIVPRRLVFAANADATEDIEPLIDPITIEPIATVQIAIDVSSGVMPIDIEPLRIEPLQGQ